LEFWLGDGRELLSSGSGMTPLYILIHQKCCILPLPSDTIRR